MNTDTDRIEKVIDLRAPLERVWRAISESEQFGSWFGVVFDGPFVPGARLQGHIVPTTVDPTIARLQEPHAGTPFVCFVERIEPLRLFSFRWHPYAVDVDADYSSEPTTLVEFTLAELEGGTRVTITESGFAQIPLARRAEAFASNADGWTAQTRLLELYLATH